MNIIISLGLAVIILVAILVIFIYVWRKVRKGGAGGATIALLGSTYDLHGKDGRRAIETVVELKAGKKLEEQESSDDDDQSTERKE